LKSLTFCTRTWAKQRVGQNLKQRVLIIQMKRAFSIFLIFLSTHVYGQNFILKNEEMIFSFNTKKGKQMVLAKDKTNEYIVYRFGTKEKIEFEFPEKSKNSWTAFKYSFYLRGGGVQNEGQDLNYLSFTNKNIKYVIYDTYYAVGEKSEVGIKVTDLKRKKVVDIKGDYKTRKGTMADFRFNNLLEITEEEE
jgi:hypothetical protein